jgi:regulator of sigma E protease
MALLQTLFYTFLALGILVTIHEFGHFWVARRCGVKVERFSIGFGKPLLRWRDSQDTEFVMAMLPLGGYVKMLDEREGNVSEIDRPYAFNTKTVWQRMAIVIAGPMANFLFAIVAFWVVFLSGERQLAPVVGGVEVGSLAEQAGFQPGMEIVAIEGVPISSWRGMSRQLFDYVGTSGDIRFIVIDNESSVQRLLPVSVSSWLREAEEAMPLRELGISPPYDLESLTLAAVSADGAGHRAGLRAGDQLMAINGETIDDVARFIETVSGSAGSVVRLQILRDEVRMVLEAIPESTEREGQMVGQLSVQLASTGKFPAGVMRKVDYSLISAIPRSINETWTSSVFVLKSIVKLVTGDLSPKNISGIIQITKVAGDAGRSGIDNFIRFVAILSIMLGVMNLLPIPVLDGGHLMYYIIEIIKGSPVSDRFQKMGYQAGFTMLIGLMLFATYNDVMRIF